MNAKLLREGDAVGQLAPGAYADITVVGANPLDDVTVLQKRGMIKDVYLGGERIDLEPSADAAPFAWEHSFRQWNDVYTRDRVAELVH